MKRTRNIALAFILLFTSPLVVFAEGDSQEGTQTVTATVPEPTWTLSVPAEPVVINYWETRKEFDYATVTAIQAPYGLGYVNTFIFHTGSFVSSASASDTMPFSLLLCEKNGTTTQKTITPNEVTKYSDFYINSDGKVVENPIGGLKNEFVIEITTAAWRAANPGNYSTVLTYSSSFMKN